MVWDGGENTRVFLDCGKNTGGRAHAVCDIDPDDPANIEDFLAFEWTQVAPQSFRLKESAPINIKSIFVTLDTSHFEMSTLNNVAEEKRSSMISILDTSQSPICPCGPPEQSPFGENSRHVRTASLSTMVFFGANAGMERG